MGTTSNTRPTLPYEQRHQPIEYRGDDGNIGETRYPINYDELYNLKGRLLTLIDATFTDPEQRKAMKDVVWQSLQSWLGDIASMGQQARTEAGWALDGSVAEYDPES